MTAQVDHILKDVTSWDKDFYICEGLIKRNSIVPVAIIRYDITIKRTPCENNVGMDY